MAPLLPHVMPGLVPGIHVFHLQYQAAKKTWMPATSAGMTAIQSDWKTLVPLPVAKIGWADNHASDCLLDRRAFYS